MHHLAASGGKAPAAQEIAMPSTTAATIQALAQQFATTAIARDALGGTPKAERDALRASGLLALSIPTARIGIARTAAGPRPVVHTTLHATPAAGAIHMRCGSHFYLISDLLKHHCPP